MAVPSVVQEVYFVQGFSVLFIPGILLVCQKSVPVQFARDCPVMCCDSRICFLEEKSCCKEEF